MLALPPTRSEDDRNSSQVFESFRSRVLPNRRTWRFSHFSQKCICVSLAMLSKEASQSRLEIGPEPELVLEFNQPAQLAELLGVFVSAEGGEHPCEVAFRSDRGP